MQCEGISEAHKVIAKGNNLKETDLAQRCNFAIKKRRVFRVWVDD